MPKTLLLADDSVTIQKVVGITFANEDVELVTVDNGDDALTRARQVKPDLVLADIGMPGLNGYELCAAIRREPNLAHIPVLLLTGTFETYDEQKAREVGASGHIAKPFEAQALVDRVFQLLAQAKPAPAPAPAPAPKPAAAPASRPAPPSAPAPQAARPAAGPPTPQPLPRPRPELPPMPNAPLRAPATPLAAKPGPGSTPTPTPRPAKRESAPFEFELPPKAPAPPTPAERAEPMWEAEPEAEVLAEEAPAHEPADFGAPLADTADAPPPDATRLFAPDLLGRAARLPDLVEPIEPPPEPPARAGDFSFDDLDFEEPTGRRAKAALKGMQSGIFGESSTPPGKPPAPIVPAGESLLEPEALADPLYSQTTFLDPSARRDDAPSFSGHPTPPPLPDLLADAPLADAEDSEDADLAEAETALDDELEATRYAPVGKPFSPDTAAALEEPRFERAPRASADAATRLVLPDEPAFEREPETPAPTRAFASAPAPRTPAAAPIADTLPPKRLPPPPAPHGATAPRASAIVDSALLAQSVEKVAWEAFGALSEQVVGEVLKRVEAVVWEVVPQLCERLIREEIARLKSEMSD